MTRFWGAITGRTAPKQANLDSLFLVPSAAVTLQTAAGFTPTGTGSVCFRAPDGAAYQQTEDDVLALLRDEADKPDVQAVSCLSNSSWLARRPSMRAKRSSRAQGGSPIASTRRRPTWPGLLR